MADESSSDENPLNPDFEQAQRAKAAFDKLVDYYKPANPFGYEVTKALRRRDLNLERYRLLSFHAEMDELTGDERKKYIKESLIKEKKIDDTDPQKANEEFEILSDGYDLNQSYWNRRLDMLGKLAE